MDQARTILACTCPRWARNNRCGSNNRSAAAGRGQFPGPTIPALFCRGRGVSKRIGPYSGLCCVAETSIASLLFYDPAYSLKVIHTVDLLAVEIYAIVAAMSVEAFCRLADSALAEKSAAISAEARLADREVSHDGAEVNVPPGALANSG